MSNSLVGCIVVSVYEHDFVIRIRYYCSSAKLTCPLRTSTQLAVINLPFVSKLLEKAVAIQLSYHIATDDLHMQLQYAVSKITTPSRHCLKSKTTFC